ncbi:MAG: dTDP-4-dehydrorhamnose 3,5-epimerase [Bacteroidetes bacterium]|nr:MAG: dTDP-4-dehydrorhamnose 3,5-epimerase [Bacteroidota bacterium]
MKLIPTRINGLFVIQPSVFEDSRGYFFESYNKDVFLKQGIDTEFVQDNQSLSQKGVLRGLHFQNPPYAQAKLVRVITGSVLDVVVDIRKNSLTYGHHFAEVLNAVRKNMLFVPVGFAHGFAVLEDNTIFSYKCSNVYNKESEESVLWCDPDLNIKWGVANPILSEKDKAAQRFKDFTSKFIAI